MNKQEALKRIEAQKETIIELTGWAVFRYIGALIEQLDEPQPVKVPQFVADWIDYFKKTGDWDLFQAMDYLFGKKEIREWLEDKNNQETFARAWLDGYEVEKEPKYTVMVKGISGYGRYLNKALLSKEYFFASENEVSGYRTKHTRKELEDADFGWVFDCPGIEIEEVE